MTRAMMAMIEGIFPIVNYLAYEMDLDHSELDQLSPKSSEYRLLWPSAVTALWSHPFY